MVSLETPCPDIRSESSAQSLADNFLEIFSLHIANNEYLRTLAHQVRYQIYCEESALESKEVHSNGLETDRYDAHAIQCVLTHRATNITVGACRVVLPNSEDWRHSFPIQQVCNDPTLHDYATVMQSCEGSRFCVSQEARKSICDTASYPSDLEDARDIAARSRRLLPYISIGIVRLMVEATLQNNFTSFYGLLDPRLVKMLMRQSICPDTTADNIEYHGIRTPTLFVPLSMFELTYKQKREVWKILSDYGRLHEIALDMQR